MMIYKINERILLKCQDEEKTFTNERLTIKKSSLK